MSGQSTSFVAVTPDPMGSGRWVVSLVTGERFVWRLFSDRDEARIEARQMAINAVEDGEDFAVWIARLPPELCCYALEATFDLVDAMISKAIASKKCADD